MAQFISDIALTFDDVLLLPGHSKVLPKDVDVSTAIGGGIQLNIPLMSAAMDTVTDARLAIALARLGGIGVIHKNMPFDRQAAEVDKVKRSESGMIVDPITFPPDRTIGEAREIMKRFSISGIPITRDGKLVGILTNRDLRFESDFSRPVHEVMTSENLVTVKEGTDLDTAKGILHRHRIEKLPIVDAENNLKGMITVKDIMKKIQFPDACKDSRGRLRVGAAVGVGKDLADRSAALIQAGVDLLVVDSSHGHSEGVLEAVKWVKQKYPNIPVMGGNVATGDGAKALIDAGADSVKVGIGPGSICTTRVVTGVGVPQITAVVNAITEAQKRNIPVISDGGIRYSGDIAKVLAVGAHAVMLGSIFAGVEEAPGESILYEGRWFKVYRGMGSLSAMKEGSKDRYFQEHEEEMSKFVPEGIEGRVPAKGPLAESVYQLIGGLRAGMGLCGAKNLEFFRTNTKVIRITNAGVSESHPHSVSITKEAPNYRRY